MTTQITEHKHEYLSVCCGAEVIGGTGDICAKCKDHSGFECECGKQVDTLAF